MCHDCFKRSLFGKTKEEAFHICAEKDIETKVVIEDLVAVPFDDKDIRRDDASRLYFVIQNGIVKLCYWY